MNPHILHHKIVMVSHTPIIFESEVSLTVLCLLCLHRYIAIRIKNCSKSTSVITVATHCRLGKLRLVFRWFYFVGHSYYEPLLCIMENTLIEHKGLWFNWRKGVRIMEDPLFTSCIHLFYVLLLFYAYGYINTLHSFVLVIDTLILLLHINMIPGPMKLFKCVYIIHSCMLSNINYLHLAYEVQDESRCLSRNCMLIK